MCDSFYSVTQLYRPHDSHLSRCTVPAVPFARLAVRRLKPSAALFIQYTQHLLLHRPGSPIRSLAVRRLKPSATPIVSLLSLSLTLTMGSGC